ncbi:porin [Gellertiella hungarica]|uniref:Porin n=1 Tax=Gellertiella hungarica TaxID=1572859 RepID=A0A7W6J6E8_9HYPH|nr:porin [Gellertiella hungarica]MBB4065614.1 hypothetical protein [Gellertiella hungarica]
MNIKSLLLGSAAALAVVSGAHAADAIVAAEPEPAEYVKVCDAFGTGYFYIPGTETCLKIGGHIRYDIKGGELLGLDTDADGEGDAWAKRAQFRLKVSTAADTEYGALKTYAEVNFNNDNSSGSTSTNLDHAYIELGGLLVGYTDSLFTQFTGYAGNVIQDALIPVGPYGVHLIQYTYDAGNGFKIAAAVEDDAGAGDGYMPNLVAGVGYNNGTFGVGLVGGYDESAEEGAIKARVDGSFGGVDVFVMAGWNTDGDFNNRYATWDGDWAVWGGFSAALSDNAKLNAQLSYDDGTNFAAVANVAFTVASGFTVTPEIDYVSNNDADTDAWGGMLRIQRSF